MKNNYQKSEKVGRQLALSYLTKEYPQYQFESMKGDFDNWDLEISNYERGSVLIECKNRRNYNSTDFEDIFLDEFKIKQCLKEMRKRKDTYGEEVELLFCATFKDGVCKLWNVKYLMQQRKFRRATEYLPVSSEEDKGYEWQDVIYFKHSDAFKVLKK